MQDKPSRLTNDGRPPGSRRQDPDARGRSIGELEFGPRILRCVLGAGGVSLHKQEGDGTTPAGLHRAAPGAVSRRPHRRSARDGRLPREPIAPDDGWCDDPTHADYNRQVRLPHEARHEIGCGGDDGLYDLMAVLAYNDDPVRRGERLGDLPACRARRRGADGGMHRSRRLPDLRWLLQNGARRPIEVPA